MNCPRCNRPITPTQLFCSGCGAKLQDAAPAAPQQPAAQPASLEVEKTVAANFDEMPAPESAPQPQAPAPAASPWSFAPGNQPTEPPAAEQPAYEPPAAEQPYAPQPQNNYEQQFRQYQQPSQYSGTQPAYQPGYNNPVATQTKKGIGTRKLVLIIVAAVVAVAVIVGGIFVFRSCASPSKGSYKDALNDVVAMMNAGQYEEVVNKYTIDNTYKMTEADRSSLALLNGMKYEIEVNESNSKVYQKGSSEYERLVSQFTSDTAKQNNISEIAAVDAKTRVSGYVMGQSMDQTENSTIYMARYNGEWKMPAATGFKPF